MRALITLLAAVACTPSPRAPKSGESYVRLERTACLGDCPVYTVTLFADGTAQYADAARGVEQRTIDPAQVTRLLDAIAQVPDWTCAPDRIATDYPQAIVTAARAGTVRRLVDDHGDPCVPPALRRIEGEIDIAGGRPQLVPFVND